MSSVIRARELPTREPLSDAELYELLTFLKKLGIEPHEGQRAFLRNRDRIKILLCGRRWGKSYTIAIEVLLHILELTALGWDYGRVRICAMNYSQIKEPFSYLRRLLEAAGIPLRVRSTREERYYLAGDVQIELRPLANRKGLRGAGLTMLVIDETSLVPEEVFHYDLLPSVTDYKGRILLAGTPAGVNWVVRYAQEWGIDVPYTDLNGAHEFRSPDGQCYLMRSPSWVNPHLDPQFIESLRRTMDPRAFAQEYGAEILVDQLDPFPIPPVLLNQPLSPTQLQHAVWAIGFDYGYMEPSAKVVVAKTVDDYYYVESVGYETQIESHRVSEWLRSDLKYPQMPIVADPALWNRDGRIAIADMLRARRLVMVRGGMNRVARWNLLRDLLAQQKLLVYAPQCEPLLMELEQATPRASQPDDIEKPDHALSALTYAIEFLYYQRGRIPHQPIGPYRGIRPAKKPSLRQSSFLKPTF